MFKNVINKIKQSPINYFSDLFIVAIVIAWIVVMFVMIVMGIYSTVVNNDNSIWSDLQIIVTCPITAGAGIWMIKNSVQHAIANNKGKRAPYDFPKVDIEEIEIEKDVDDKQDE